MFSAQAMHYHVKFCELNKPRKLLDLFWGIAVSIANKKDASGQDLGLTPSSEGKSQKANKADQDVKDAESQVTQLQALEQRGSDAPQTVDELLDALDKGQAWYGLFYCA